mgnify:FL=1
MKKLVCELCGSDDIVKQEGCFVCQQCGTKYSIEEAKRMMMEGGDAAPGITVKVDNSSFVERYLQNARRAKAKEDWEETEKYYNMVEQNEPTNIEAVFYSAYGKARTALISEDYYKKEAVFRVLQNTISVISDDFVVEKAEEEKPLLEQIKTDIAGLYKSNFVYNKTTKDGVTTSNEAKIKELFTNTSIAFMNALDKVAAKLPDEQKKERAWYYKLAISLADYVRALKVSPTISREELLKFHQKIKEVDPLYKVPEIEADPACYVATAVYGSYDCPQVWTLRRYRDDTLAKTWYGRAFVRTYYAVSPTLVKWFGETAWFKKLWRGKLDNMVKRLNAEGYENTPYRDKNW